MATTETAGDETKKVLLVDENQPTTLEQALKSLADSREEIARSSKHSERLVNSLKDKGKEVERLNEKLKQATKPFEAPPGAVSEAKADEESYTGPTQKEIYLAIVQGVMSSLDPSKLSDKVIGDMSASVIGMAEIFYHKAARRVSFGANKK